MITVYKQGDLLNAFDMNEFDAIIHGCNCFHTMGAGIAGVIAERYPIAYEADLKTNYGDWEKLGDYSFAEHANGTIINAYTQFQPGRVPRDELYRNIEKCFSRINEHYSGYGKIGIPMIGAGIAGGDWVKISEIIGNATYSLDLTCYYI